MYIYILFLSILPTLLGLRIIKSGSVPASSSRIGLEFFVVLDNENNGDFHVELIPDECCLQTGEEDDCDALQIIGECYGVIPRESATALTLVAPIIGPFERQGSCTIHVNSRPVDRTRAIKRETLKIRFDTTVKDRDNIENVIQYENKDENPEKNGNPVNCETFYNGRRSFFDKRTNRCKKTPYYIDRKRNGKIQIYDPIKNKCIDEFSVSNDDIDFKDTNDKVHTKDILVIESVDKTVNESKPKYSIDNDPELIDDINHNHSKPKLIQIRTKIYAQTLMKSLFSNKYTVIILLLIIISQCCLIIFIVYCLTNSTSCCTKNKVVTRFFSYRQDASVTTPLIGTSNMDTETTEFDYISETSNIDNKIKCYKACQKERLNNAKISMSDDILSKCLARRDWSSKPKSEIVTDPTSVINFEFKCPTKDIKDPVNEDQNIALVEQKIETINKIDSKCYKDIKSNTGSKKIDIQIPENNPGSEREIQCLNYNLAQSQNNFKSTDNLHGKSVSAGKSAQVCFSNDSLDDFLSERGILFKENASRTSFDSSSSDSSSTELTSKPSKNNIIKNVLSFLTKSKTTESDPGSKSKRKQLELIHLSKATFSSSTDNAKVTKSRFFGSGASQISK